MYLFGVVAVGLGRGRRGLRAGLAAAGAAAAAAGCRVLHGDRCAPIQGEVRDAITIRTETRREPDRLGAQARRAADRHATTRLPRVLGLRALLPREGDPRRRRRGEIIEEKCVACGLCVSECGNRGHVVRDDTPRVSGAARVAAVRSSRCSPPSSSRRCTRWRPRRSSARSRRSGFYAVESTLLGEEIVAAAYEKRHTRATGVPVIRSTCPVVDRVGAPLPSRARAGALAPVVPPYVAQARLVRDAVPGRRGRRLRRARATRARTSGATRSSTARSTWRSTSPSCSGCSTRRGRRAGRDRRRRCRRAPPRAAQGALAHRRLPARDARVARRCSHRTSHVVRGLQRPRPPALRASRRGEVGPAHRRRAQLRGLHRRPGGEPGHVAVREAQHRGRRARGAGPLRREQPRAAPAPARGRPRARVPARARRGPDARPTREIDAILAEGELRRRAETHRLRRVRLRDLRRARGRHLPGQLVLGHVLPAAARALLERSARRSSRSPRRSTRSPACGTGGCSPSASPTRSRGTSATARRVSLLMIDLDGFKEHQRPLRARRGRRGARGGRPSILRGSLRVDRPAGALRRRRVRRHPARACARPTRSPWPRSCATAVAAPATRSRATGMTARRRHASPIGVARATPRDDRRRRR